MTIMTARETVARLSPIVELRQYDLRARHARHADRHLRPPLRRRPGGRGDGDHRPVPRPRQSRQFRLAARIPGHGGAAQGADRPSIPARSGWPSATPPTQRCCASTTCCCCGPPGRTAAFVLDVADRPRPGADRRGRRPGRGEHLSRAWRRRSFRGVAPRHMLPIIREAGAESWRLRHRAGGKHLSGAAGADRSVAIFASPMRRARRSRAVLAGPAMGEGGGGACRRTAADPAACADGAFTAALSAQPISSTWQAPGRSGRTAWRSIFEAAGEIGRPEHVARPDVRLSRLLQDALVAARPADRI